MEVVNVHNTDLSDSHNDILISKLTSENLGKMMTIKRRATGQQTRTERLQRNLRFSHIHLEEK